MTNPIPVCQVCGEPMPPGEEVFNYHGYSGPCPKPPKSPQTSEKGWEDELDEKIYAFDSKGLTEESYKSLKSFISNLLLAERSKLLHAIKEEVEGMKKTHEEFECQTYEMMCNNQDCPSVNAGKIRTYNQALSDLLSKLEAIN